MSSSPEIVQAREEVLRTRERLGETYEEVQGRITAPARKAASALDVGAAVRGYPWAALAVAVGAGALVASTGVDRRAAAAAVETARQAKRKTASTARTAPSRARGAISVATDALATRVLTSVIQSLRGRPRTEAPAPPRDALGFVRTTTPAHEGEATG